MSLVMAVPVWGQETYRAVDLGLSVCWAAQNVDGMGTGDDIKMDDGRGMRADD